MYGNIFFTLFMHFKEVFMSIIHGVKKGKRFNTAFVSCVIIWGSTPFPTPPPRPVQKNFFLKYNADMIVK